MKPLIVIQARTGSTRLPNKMIKPFYGEKSVLEILLQRLKMALNKKDYLEIVVATTDNPNDDAIVNICKKNGVEYYRGSEKDVLQRFVDVGKKYKAEKLIRICGDNVFLDTSVLKVLCATLEGSVYDYVAFETKDKTPSILTHFGLFAEGVKLSALEDVVNRTNKAEFHEHVTNRIYTAPDIYTVKFFSIDDTIKGLEQHKDLRLTLDTQEDFKMQQTIYKEMMESGTDITTENIISFIEDKHPEFYNVMKEIINKNKK